MNEWKGRSHCRRLIAAYIHIALQARFVTDAAMYFSYQLRRTNAIKTLICFTYVVWMHMSLHGGTIESDSSLESSPL